jgi:glycosyltransferase involved in cell wall biosynthesis
VYWLPIIPEYETFLDPPNAAIERAAKDYHLDPGRRRIVFPARMQKVKRPDLAIKAFEAIADDRPEWDLLMIGDGPLREAYAASVSQRLQHRVLWTGFLNDREVLSGIYHQSDVLLLPSDEEPWGMVVIEAAAAGLAMVLSDVVGAAPELLQEDRNGFLAPAGSLSRLVEALRRVTDALHIDRLKAGSREVLRAWAARSDPVAGVRAALASCNLLNSNVASRIGSRAGDGEMLAGPERMEFSIQK